MPASTRFLSPNPPVLFSPPTKQVASGSTNSFSSSSSCSNSRSTGYFDRLSRASGASAYLTDLTPPITPSNSNFEVESKDSNFNRVLESSVSVKKPYPIVRPLSDEDGGYRSDIDVVSAVPNPGTGVAKSKRGTSRRALRLMEVHNHSQVDSDSEDVGVDVPLLKEGVTGNSAAAAEGPEVDGELEREYFDEENFSRDFDRAMDLIYQEAMNGTFIIDDLPENPSTTDIAPQVDLLGDESDLHIPAKPVIKALEVDSDCSPLSLCDYPSFESISRSLPSPIQPDPLPMSPAIYNDPPRHGNSPLSSPHMGISTLMFGARGERRSFPPVDLTGENLDTASLIRLELAAGNNFVHPNLQPQMGFGFHMPPQSHLPPSPFTSYPSLQSFEHEMDLNPRHCSFSITSPAFAQNSSPFSDQNKTSVESGDFPRVRDVSLSLLPVDRDQALVGLGLGALTEGCLRSSDSITKLDSVEPRSIVSPGANGCTADIALDIQQCSPCADDIEGYLKTGIEPSGVLSVSESLRSPPSHTSAFIPEVQVGLASYQVDLGDNAGQVSIEGNISFPLENVVVDVTVESESERNALSDSMSRTDVFPGLITSGRRCSIKSPKNSFPQDGAREEDIRCPTPLTVQAPTFTGTHASSYPFDAVPITPDYTHTHSTSTLAENVPGAEPSLPEALLAVSWSDDTPRQSIEHSSLLFQDSPLRRLTLALESDKFLARLRQSRASPPAPSKGPSSHTVSPTNDPRSPCSPPMEYFHPESYIRGCLGVLPSAQSSSGGGNAPLLSSSRPDSTAFPSFSGLLRESKSFEGLGLGLPSDLVSGPLRQYGSSNQRADLNRSETMSTREECQDIAHLADTISSPNGGTPNSTSPRVLFQAPTFAQRRLYVIPEQPTPLSTFSSVRSRSLSSGSRPSEPSWSARSVLDRLRTSSRPTWRPFSRKDISDDEGGQIPDRRHGSSSSVNGPDCPLAEISEDGPSPPSTKPKGLFKRIFQKIGRRRSDCVPSTSSPQPDGVTVRSPGVIEHPDVPRGFNILARRRRGRHDPVARKFRVLF